MSKNETMVNLEIEQHLFHVIEKYAKINKISFDEAVNLLVKKVVSPLKKFNRGVVSPQPAT